MATRELNLVLPRGRRPSYLKIAEAIRLAIESGQARPGERLPSTRALAERIGVHRHTIMAALGELLAEGWLSSQERSSYRIPETLPIAHSPQPPGRPVADGGKAHGFSIRRKAGNELPLWQPSNALRYPFLSGQPDLRLFPHEEFRSHVNDSLRRNPRRVLEYGDPAGHGPFIAELKTFLRRTRAVSDREILVTNGAQEAIFLTGQLLLGPGDAAAVEGVGYRPAWEALRAAGARLYPVKVDADGLIPESLERLFKKTRIRLLYLTPLHQYPTTVPLPMPRRAEIYRLAARFDVPILEDDYDHEFHYRSQPLAPLASRDPDGRVVYVSTLSKVLFPSARLGFLAAPPGFFEVRAGSAEL